MVSNKQEIHCDECDSTNIRKHGKGIRDRKEVQQYFCKDCKKIFRLKDKE